MSNKDRLLDKTKKSRSDLQNKTEALYVNSPLREITIGRHSVLLFWPGAILLQRKNLTEMRIHLQPAMEIIGSTFKAQKFCGRSRSSSYNIGASDCDGCRLN